MRVFQERGKWVCRLRVCGVVQEFMDASRAEAMKRAYRWGMEMIRKENAA